MEDEALDDYLRTDECTTGHYFLRINEEEFGYAEGTVV